ncbi:hypothetical protein [Comamonas testosteroni]|uniref:Uncharacterized protein n=1 Tax=Comamonas testosteroni TaxID=285 RepID=A0A8B4S9C3_COMTE|nr:hypothetical protein [Comamonas testosteroni]EHN64281.1 hypothetical protein CTATCC11996_18667 [Comamonas testosteroni ATCC 11996]QQN67800.1 hypothetical protein IYN88_13225 [Comamonas testosteroni]SUY79013.1 Uncharacterised protein [Comamonas testosteroni]
MRNKSSVSLTRQLLQSQQQLVMQIQAQTQAVNRLAQSIEQLAEVIALDYAEQDLPTNVGLDGRALG